MVEGVDYAGTRPSPAGLYAAGKRFVVRYGGPGGSWKHLDATEARALTGAGLALVANAEGAADGLLLGWDAGVSWARSADAHFRGLGMPANRPIYLSVDFDCGPDKQWAAVANALRGAASVIGAGRVGVYGSYDVMQWAKRDGVARWYWQTYAWSAGRWAAHNHLEQYRNGVSLAGGTVDLNRSKAADFGQWGQGEDDDMMELTDPLPSPKETLATGEVIPAGNYTVGERLAWAHHSAWAAHWTARGALAAAKAADAKVTQLLERPAVQAAPVDPAALKAALLDPEVLAAIAKAVADEDHRRSAA